MHRPLSRPLTSSVARAVGEGGVASFSVTSLFAAGEQGGIYDISDLSTLFSDAAGTTPATVDGVVGKVLDKSGRGNHRTQSTTASKPILRSSGGLYWLEYDGVDDFMVTASIDLTGTDKLLIVAGIRKASDAAIAAFLTHGTSPANAGEWELNAPPTAGTAAYRIAARSSTGTAGITGKVATGFAAGTSHVVTCAIDYAAAGETNEFPLRINGAASGTAIGAQENSGAFGNKVLYVGRRAGATLAFNGREYYTVLRAGASTATQVSSTERIAAQKCGVTL